MIGPNPGSSLRGGRGGRGAENSRLTLGLFFLSHASQHNAPTSTPLTATLPLTHLLLTGHGQGLNARDNGLNVIVGVRKDGESWKQALEDGWVSPSDGERAGRFQTAIEEEEEEEDGGNGLSHPGLRWEQPGTTL